MLGAWQSGEGGVGGAWRTDADGRRDEEGSGGPYVKGEGVLEAITMCYSTDINHQYPQRIVLEKSAQTK
jgi:hypothetical protein